MPPAVRFRNRPVLEHIVEQHAEEAAFLWTLRDAATEAPHYKRHHLARLDERVEAHVDGLRVAGEAGWRIALEQMERRCEKGELFASGVLALESGDMRRIEPLAARAQAEPEARRGFVGAIAWCRPGALAPAVRNWAGSAEAFGRYLALCACSVHRAEPGKRFADQLRDPDPLVRGRALRLAGELGRRDSKAECLDQVGTGETDAAFWAAWAAVLLGDRESALLVLRGVAAGGGARGQAALELACRAAPIGASAEWLRSFRHDAGRRRLVVAALGHVGDPGGVPWLLDRVEEQDLARATGGAVSLITGVDIEDERLDRAGPARQADADEDGAIDPDADLPWPDPVSVRRWWEREGGRFARGKRYLLGSAVGAAACEHAWREGVQAQRRTAAIELALGAGGRLRCWSATEAGSLRGRDRPADRFAG